MQVVPFSPASGLLEWVEDTIPVHEYLTGKDKASGAHKRYSRPGDLSFAQCMQTMHKAKRTQLRRTFDHVSLVLHRQMRQNTVSSNVYAALHTVCLLSFRYLSAWCTFFMKQA